MNVKQFAFSSSQALAQYIKQAVDEIMFQISLLNEHIWMTSEAKGMSKAYAT